MPEYYQIIVVCDVDAFDAQRTGRKALEWLADELVIQDEPTACVPDNRQGFGPAELWQSAIVEIDESFLGMEINGVEAATGRQVFDAGDYEPTPYCPTCHAPVASDSPKVPVGSEVTGWQEALDAWARGDNRAAFACPACAATSPIVDWRHDPPIGFGNLGLFFWNWPSLNREFISRLAAALNHRLVLIEGRRAS
jgi:hypothetical protein